MAEWDYEEDEEFEEFDGESWRGWLTPRARGRCYMAEEKMETTRVVEIGGVKVEVDFRTAKQVECFRVGDRCKLLTFGRYSSPQYRVHHGVIVAFDQFEKMPTIVVCYLTDGSSPTLEFAYINSETEGFELAVSNDDPQVDKAEIVDRLTRAIVVKETEAADLKAKLHYFVEKFGVLFGKEAGGSA